MVRMNVDLPEPDGPGDDHDLAGLDVEVDAAQDVQLAEPLVDVAADDDVAARRVSTAHRLIAPTPSSRSRR